MLLGHIPCILLGGWRGRDGQKDKENSHCLPIFLNCFLGKTLKILSASNYFLGPFFYPTCHLRYCFLVLPPPRPHNFSLPNMYTPHPVLQGTFVRRFYDGSRLENV